MNQSKSQTIEYKSRCYWELEIFPRSYENTRKYYDVEQWIKHRHYNSHKIVNDIAVVQVKGEIEFNERVQPIGFSSTPVPAGAHVQHYGWGKTHASILHLYLFYFIMNRYN